MYPWLIPQWHSLLEVARGGRLGHAWLLLGDEGLGKEQLADALAQRHLCQQLVDDHPCGHCHACQLLAKGHHPDLGRVGREGKSIGVDPVRALCQRLGESPQLGRGKVVIIEQAERMTEAAANALLKTLEEPAGNSLILLLASQSSRLLPTILSRCNKHLCPIPAESLTLRWLEEQGVHATPSQVRICQGAPLRVKAYLEEGGDDERRSLLEQLCRLSRHPAELPGLATRIANDLERHLPWLQLLINDALKLQARCPIEQLSMPDLSLPLSELAESRSSELLLHAQTQLLSVRETCQPGQLVNPAVHLHKWLGHWL
ncbi:DNA polymerase III subunit delta' [Aeromonas diversa CDC 2478-85]|uniref:DNA polymerase III subunit delta' n=1 Tax=Aeromonas diversa CDC 2478-85 TaxID=1268237 RepID=N9U183_9GAMM|nr:DNA polymerase III subunit delta' [Aeromonas diversa]ENY72080.1 DNA polymerase III subunit delta' [Aeromonas diversa CDC 2478-85]